MAKVDKLYTHLRKAGLSAEDIANSNFEVEHDRELRGDAPFSTHTYGRFVLAVPRRKWERWEDRLAELAEAELAEEGHTEHHGADTGPSGF